MGQRIGVLMGGWGEEREISLKTGAAVLSALSALGHQVCRIEAGPGLDAALREARPEVAFVALHGRLGEDGAVQGLLELFGIPYTGSGVLASALAMNKPYAKKLFTLHNLPCPRGYVVAQADAGRSPELHGDLGFPAVVKPARGGSSVGLGLVASAEALPEAVRLAASFGGEALVERKVEGREVTVAILGEKALGTCEISCGDGVFDYAHKYRGGSRYHVPARMSAARRSNVEALALRAYRSLGCRGYARVDFICGESDNDVLLEVNTLPGFTPTSLFPKIAAQAGLSFPDVVREILSLAALDSAEGREAERSPRKALRRAG